MVADPRTTELLADGPRRAYVREYRLTIDGRAQAFASPRLVIGADLRADLVIADSAMSKFHCEIRIANGAATVRDLGSRNGTLVDHVRVIEAPLRDGAILALGRTTLRFDLGTRDVELALSPRTRFGRLGGGSVVMRATFAQLEAAAASTATVLLQGESGTGKELAARSIHELSRRRSCPFVAVNCGAISANLMESEIFGHERGSFTGADRLHQGFFERAHGGTLFLDEITEMPASLQVKLLRVLETGTYMRVGSAVSQSSDVRVIAATNRDLREAVASGTLREDLYYRLNVFSLAMPPLRERIEDVPLLASHFLRDIGRKEGELRRASDVTLETLKSRAWPGNVRELRNALQRAWVMADGVEVGPDWLHVPRQSAPLASSDPDVLQVRVGTPLSRIEREVILATYEQTGRNKEKTAAVLGISLKTLYNRLKEYSG
jgi:DNA-binding NtrC family response regulator